ncbi:hypothetical protein [Mucilaginibacter sp.]|uniref:hypothetical protein n=1 Tax=Mucilaginibacter sp. TaxID=1882438 RepID=UPI003263DB96
MNSFIAYRPYFMNTLGELSYSDFQQAGIELHRAQPALNFFKPLLIYHPSSGPLPSDMFYEDLEFWDDQAVSWFPQPLRNAFKIL